MAAQDYIPEVDPADPPQGWKRLLQVTTVAGREGAPWEALYTALYWGQGAANSPGTPEPTRPGSAGRSHEELPAPPPFRRQPTRTAIAHRPPETVLKLADLTRNRAKATMQTTAEPPLRDPDRQATHPFFQSHPPQSHHLQYRPRRTHS